MNRFFGILSVLALMMAVAVGCKKKEAVGGEPPAAGASTDPAAAPAAEPAGDKAAAAAPPAAPAAGGDISMDDACTKSIAMIEAMGAAVAANKGNCDAMGDALQKWADDNKDFIAWGKANDGDAAKKKEFQDTCAPKMTPVFEKVGPSLQGAQDCGTNEKVKAALATFE